MSSESQALPNLFLTTIVRGKHHLHIPDGMTEAERGKVTYLKSHSWSMTELRFQSFPPSSGTFTYSVSQRSLLAIEGES